MLTELKDMVPRFDPLVNIRIDSMHLLDQGMTKLLVTMTVNVTAKADVTRVRKQMGKSRPLLKMESIQEMLTTRLPSEVFKK